MITSKAATASRIGPIEQALLRVMDRSRQRIWMLGSADVPPGLTDDQVRHALSRLAEARLIDRIERGTYLVMPRSGRIPVQPLDLLGSWLRDEPYAVVGLAAAEVHHLSMDTPSTIEVQIARRKAPVTFRGSQFVFTAANKQSVAQDNVRVKVGEGTCTVASPGKVVVRLLAQESSRRGMRPSRDASLAAEMLERGRGRDLWSRTDWKSLVMRHGNSLAARRLGYLLDQLGIGGSEDVMPLRGVSGNKPFSPLYPPRGPVSKRWRLVINDPALPPGGRDANAVG